MAAPTIIPTIFVQIASYRDTECHATIRDLFEKAARPERITVGVCWQYDPETDAGLLKEFYPYPDQVRVVHYHPKDSKGAGWAREEAQKLWRGETHTLQVQAHMRFEPGWDEALLSMLARAPSDHPVICLYPANYDPARESKKERVVCRTRVSSIAPNSDPQIVHLFCDKITGEDPRVGLYQTPYWIGCFMFAQSDVFQRVPHDPHIYFWGEEIAYSARLWTHGYDLFQNDQPVVYHQWFRDRNDGKHDFRAHEDPRNVRSLKRIRHLLGLSESKDAEVTAELAQYGLGKKRQLQDFFSFAGLDFKTKKVTPAAQRGFWQTPVDEEWGKGKIFVAIASYRDPECQHTVKDLFEKAKHPERIFVGLCWQYDEEYDANCFEVKNPRPEQTRIYKHDWREAMGVCWARWRTQDLWRGEEFALQIDSHMRFEEGWDEKMMAELAACNAEKPILSSSIATYTPPNELDKNPKPSVLRSGVFTDEGAIRNRAANLSAFPEKPLNAAFIAAGFMFSKSALLREVPYDPYMYFDQEEITLAMRFFTHGWDMFSARRPIVYHYYIKAGENVRPLHWSDTRTEDAQKKRYLYLRERSKARFNHLTRYMTSKAEDVLEGLEFYSLGKARTLEDYERYCGIDFRSKRISEFALRGEFIEGLHRYLTREKLYVPELDEKDAKPLPQMMTEEERLRMHQDEGAPLPRIFVQIASYRDPECQHTVKNLFESAKHPERIFVGICWQFDADEDKACFEVPYPYPKQVRSRHYHPTQSKGGNWARAEAQSLWQGEEYVLQIDSHMRFEEGWDDTLVFMLDRTNDPKAVLSTFLPGYSPPFEKKVSGERISRVMVRDFVNAGNAGVVHLSGGLYLPNDANRKGLYPSPFIVGNFMFARAEMMRDVPIDPYIYFYGDEISYSTRLWTHGYTVYQPDRLVAYHYWDKPPVAGSNYKSLAEARAKSSAQRVAHLIGLAMSENEEVLKDLDLYGHGTARDLDDFWVFAGVEPFNKTISDLAKKGMWDINMLKKATVPRAQPRIFVQIASYRDPECQHTVKELFEKATYPERVNVGICWQFIKEEDADFFEVPHPRPDQVRVIEIDAREAMGVCWARAKVQGLWQGEEYTLQIDSHMRFEQGWDEALISMLGACPSAKNILTTYPAGYTPPRTIPNRITHRLVAKQFDKEGIFTMTSRPVPNPPAPAPVKGAFAGACMLFGKSDIIRDVPYDPHLYFFGEEITLTVRLWTHGYDIYHPQYPVMYHCWDRTGRRTHFEDHRNWGQLNKRSFARVRHMLGTEKSTNPEVVREIEKYGLGKARSLAEYQAYSGVNFAEKSISASAYEGRFPADVKGSAPAQAKQVTAQHKPEARPPIAAGSGNGPRLTLSTEDVMIFDDFLPEDVYQKLYDYTVQMDYQYINTQGKVRRVWDLTNGFPLRSDRTMFYYADPSQRPENVPPHPSRTPFDLFIDHTNRIIPQVAHKVGAAGASGWEHFSVTAWLYPQGTGLSMHDDGSGIYTGAYVYFLTPEWKPHWGGQLLVMDHESNLAIKEFKKNTDGHAFHKKKFLHESEHNELVMGTGYAQCVFPKRNRMVFIHPEAFHMVTQVTPSAGDNVRMSLAGFFHRQKKKEGK